MPATDRDVFAHFLNDNTISREIALLAYASYAEAKYDWMALFEERYGHPPAEEQANEWTASLPASRLNEIRATAVAFFTDAATAYSLPQIEAARDEAVSSSILAEVKRLNLDLAGKVEHATSFGGTWKQGLFLGVAASFAFAALVIAGGFIFDRDPSPFGWFKPKPVSVAPPSSAAPQR